MRRWAGWWVSGLCIIWIGGCDEGAKEASADVAASADSAAAGTDTARGSGTDATATETGSDSGPDDTDVEASAASCERRSLSLPDQVVTGREVDELGGDGRLLRTRGFVGMSDTPAWIEESTYDSAGRRVALQHDDGLDGTIDWARTWRYDDAGHTVEERYDGARWAPWIRRVERDFDAASGAIVAKRIFARSEDTPDVVIAYTLDQGRPVAARVTDTTVDPSLSTRAFRYDGQGRLIETAIDYEDDGTVDRYWTFDYDSDGHMRELGDRDGQRVWVEGTTLLFDHQDRVLRATWDSTLDGIEESDFRYHADELGGGLAATDFGYPREQHLTTRTTWSPGCHARASWQGYVPSVELDL